MRKFIKALSILLGISGYVCLAVIVILFLRQTKAAKDAEEALEEMREPAEAVSPITKEPQAEGTPLPTLSPLPEPQATPTPEAAPEPTPTPEPVLAENPYKESFLANEDMAAWLKIDGTEIDYPVMWTPRDENYYLYRSFNGTEDKNGCLILDTDSSLDPLTTNLIIHGHNMRSGAMFGNLTDYESEDYYQSHKNITLYTEECRRDYEIIAVFRSQVYRKSDKVFKFYKFFQADTQEEFDDFYQNIKELSQYDTGVTAEFGDRFITLSTCVYHVEQGRFVVVAKEISSDTPYAPFRDRENINQPQEVSP